jgi:hypothetical protein
MNSTSKKRSGRKLGTGRVRAAGDKRPADAINIVIALAMVGAIK